MVSIGSALTQGAVIAITIKGIDKFSSTFHKANTATKKLGAVLKGGAIGIGLVGVAIAGAGVAATKIAADFEQTTVAFTTMMGSAEKAEGFLKELADFAKKTPFTLTGVEKSARQLMAVGFEAEDVLPNLKNIGDISAGLGMGEVGLQRLILNLGQVKAQGKLTGRELRDFAVAGIPMIDELAKHFGVAKEEVAEMVSKGLVKTDDVLKVFENMTGEGGRFANLMAKQAETVKGKFSNLQDTIELLGRELGSVLIPLVTDIADIFLNDLLPALQPLIPMIGDFLKRALEGIMPFLPQIVNSIMKLVEFTLKLFEALLPLMEPLMELAFIIFDALLEILTPLIPSIQSLAEVLVPIIKILTPIIILVSKLINEFVELGAGVIVNLLVPVLELITPIFEGIAKVLGIVIAAVTTVVGWIKTLVEWLSKISFGLLESAVGFVGKTLGIKTKKVGDAIIRPNGQIIETHPQDTLIATKHPESALGGITIIIENLVANDAASVADLLQDALKNRISI